MQRYDEAVAHIHRARDLVQATDTTVCVVALARGDGALFDLDFFFLLTDTASFLRLLIYDKTYLADC